MHILFPALLLGFIAVTRTIAATQQPVSTHVTQEVTQLRVDVERLQTTPDGLYVLVTLAYHNPTATPRTIGLHQWANAHTQLGDNVHQHYTLVQTLGIGYGYDRHDWLVLEAMATPRRPCSSGSKILRTAKRRRTPLPASNRSSAMTRTD